MTNEEMLGVAEIVERATNRFNEQAARFRERSAAYDRLIADMNADHETKMAEHRAAFGARTEADRKIIAGLREESAKCQAELDDLYQREGIEKKRRMDVEDERNALRAEVAALQERLRSSIARGDFAQMEVAALKSQSPKHPVKVGEWVKAPLGTRGKVVSLGVDYLEVELTNGPPTRWWPVYMCEPCDPPQTEPVPKLTHPVAVGGYLRRLTGFNTTPAGEVARVTLVDDDDPSQVDYEVMRPNGQKGRWSAKGCEPCDPPAADHDTEAGKAAAGAALKTEPVAEEIKVGDLVEVVSNTGRNTWLADVGSVGTVVTVEEINDSISVHLDDVPGKKNALAGYVSFCDVRKVTT